MNGREPRRLGRAWLQAYRADVPDTVELRRAYRRFVARQARPAPARLGVGLVAALVLLGGAAFAASGEPLRLLKAAFAPSPAASTTPPRLATGQQRYTRDQSSAPIVAPIESAPELAAPASAAPAQTPSSASLPRRAASATQPGVAVGKSQSASEPISAPSSSANDAWQRAAASLRSKDFAGAEVAFRQIELNGSASERDAAQLAHAELLLARSQPAAAINLLRSLAERAQSPFVRQRARELLQRAQAKEHADE